ncbi:MAG: DUF1003 domain-containing protein [Candidatus Parcubacteria bacterium]|nr:DUF1003 domain-containing protein [Candidatus Paceibacterota bacterium]
MTIQNTNNLHQDKLNPLDRFAFSITSRVGTVQFFGLIFIWTTLWLSWNTFAPSSLRFDPYPAFVLWLIISNLIQILLMPLVLIAQNLQSQRSEIRAENDYQINLKAEREVAQILEELNEQKKLLETIIKLRK